MLKIAHKEKEFLLTLLLSFFAFFGGGVGFFLFIYYFVFNQSLIGIFSSIVMTLIGIIAIAFLFREKINEDK